MIKLNSDEATMPDFNYSIEEIKTWRSRYSKQEYPQKVMINTFYRQHTVNFMWEFLYSPFNKSIIDSPKFNDYVLAKQHINQIYNQTKLYKTQSSLFSLLEKKADVGGLIYNNMAKLADDANNITVEELEFTYIYYTIANEFLFRWSACGMIGINKFDSFIAVTGFGVNTENMIDYESSVNLLGKLGASQFLNKHYKSLSSYY